MMLVRQDDRLQAEPQTYCFSSPECDRISPESVANSEESRMTKATLSPRIPDSGQRNAFVSPNSDCFSALRDSVSTLPLGKDDSGPKFPAVIFD